MWDGVNPSACSVCKPSCNICNNWGDCIECQNGL